VSRPRLLFISLRFLFPLDEGGKIRTAGVLRAMKGGSFEIVLASPVPRDAGRYEDDLAGICDRFVGWPKPRVAQIRRVAALAGTLPVSVACEHSVFGADIVAREVKARPDLVVADFPHAAIVLPQRLGLPSAMFTHNVEAEIFERHAKVAHGAWKLVWQREAWKMCRFEQASLRRFDTVIAVSERDGRVLRERYGLSHVETIDTGVDLDFYTFHPPAESAQTVVFAGAMDSRSNIDAIEFLMREIWPLVAAARPEARMVVVGRNPPATLVAEARRRRLAWEFTGFVDDIRPAVLAADVSVIPLRIGSGTRLKAFEAMALGRPVVSTTLGMEGLAVAASEHCLLVDTAEGFAAAILRLLADAALRRRLAVAARRLLEARFSWSAVGRQFEAICHRTLDRRMAAAS
jgi:glycosyltransferase involved in cell wall biosynthesis